MEKIRVVVSGAYGRMGQEVMKASPPKRICLW